MHAQDRSNPRQLQTSDGLKHLNEMPVYFAHEILRLGEAFEEELGKTGNPADEALQELACEKRKETINNAECVVNSTIAQQHAEEKQQTLKPVFGF